MKKIILSVAALVAFGFAAQAQEVKFGVKAGMNYSTLTGDDIEDASGRVGLHVGGLVELKLTDKFSIQPELLYSMQGVDNESSSVESTGFSTTTTTSEDKLKLDYIAIPIMAKYYIIEGLSVEAGPQVSFLVNAESESEFSSTTTVNFMGTTTSTTTSGSETTDAKDFYKGVDFGFNIGAGYELPMGLFFQARYNLGLSKIGEEYDFMGTTYEAADVRNSVFQLSVGWKF